MRLCGWVHGLEVDVAAWYNKIAWVPASPISTVKDNDIQFRFEQVFYRKFGGCPFNSPYVQSLLRTMNLLAVMQSNPLLGHSQQSLVDGKLQVFTAANVLAEGGRLHRGVSCLTAGLVLVHGDDAIADWGRFCSSSKQQWIPIQSAVHYWLGLRARANGDGQSLAMHTAALAMDGLQVAGLQVQSGNLPTGDANVTWLCAAFEIPNYLGLVPLISPKLPWPAPPANDLGLFAWAVDLRYGANTSGDAVGFGDLTATKAGSAAAVTADWCLDPKMARRKAATTRAFACAVAGTKSQGMFVPGQVSAQCWAVKTVAAALGIDSAIVASSVELDEQIQRFFRLDINNLGWADSVWPVPKKGTMFNLLGLKWTEFDAGQGATYSGQVGGAGGFWKGPAEPPDAPQFFPSCQAYRLYPTSDDFATLPLGNTVQVYYAQWRDPAVRAAVIQFAVEALDWAATVA